MRRGEEDRSLCEKKARSRRQLAHYILFSFYAGLDAADVTNVEVTVLQHELSLLKKRKQEYLSYQL